MTHDKTAPRGFGRVAWAVLLVTATVAACSATTGGGTTFDAGMEAGVDARACTERPISDGCPCSETGAIRCYPGAGHECISGTWRHFWDGPCDTRDVGPPWSTADCPTDLGAALGTRCAHEGQICGSCADPCRFCGVIRCERGAWGRVEVPPLPCDAGAEGG